MVAIVEGGSCVDVSVPDRVPGVVCTVTGMVLLFPAPEGDVLAEPFDCGGEELEDRLEVAQVQMEIFHALLPRIGEEGEVGLKIQALNQRLFDITEVNNFLSGEDFI